jgi:hypothetical protein
MDRLPGRALLIPVLSAFVLSSTVAGQASAPARYRLGTLGDLELRIEGDDIWALNAYSPAGDVDGDGRGDLIVRLATRTMLLPDRVLLLYGSEWEGGALDLASPVLRKTAISIQGHSEVEIENITLMGSSTLSGGMDVNGDGRPDLLVASQFEMAQFGPVVIAIFGGSLPEEVDPASIPSEVPGATIRDRDESMGGRLGRCASLFDDLNRDGLAEIALLDPGPSDRSSPSRVYLVFGSRDLPALIDLGDVGKGVPGFVLEHDGSYPIHRIASLGDVDDDGLGDFGLSTDWGGSKESFLVFGKTVWGSRLTMASLSPVRFLGFDPIEAAGDVDGDTKADVLLNIVAPNEDARLHILPGSRREVLPSDVDEGLLVDSLGATTIRYSQIISPGHPSSLVTSLSPGHGEDMDGDGKADVIFGIPLRHSELGPVAVGYAGAALLLKGRSPLPAGIKADNVAADGEGLFLEGSTPNGRAGIGLAHLGDFDGDGVGDLLVASRESDCAREWPLGYVLSLISGEVLVPLDQPAVSAILPTKGPSSGKNLVLILGLGFGPGPKVLFGQREAEVVSAIGDGVLIVEAPRADAGGTVKVRVENVLGASAGEIEYRYVAQDSILVKAGESRVMSIRHSSPSTCLCLGVAAGDFDGDSKTDLAMADARSSPELHIVFGRGEKGPDIDLDSLSLPQGTTIPSSRDEGGGVEWLFGGGDVNGDGTDDILVRVETRDADSTLTWEWRVVLGMSAWPPDTALKDLPGMIAIATSRKPFYIRAGSAIVPDLDGDGIDDLLLSGSNGQEEWIFVLRGRTDWPERVLLEDAASEQLAAWLVSDVRLSDFAGAAGDFNQDGAPDFYFGGTGAMGGGAMVVLYGSPILFSGVPIDLTHSLFGDNAGLLMAGTTIEPSVDPNAVFPGDLDGDGREEAFFRIGEKFGCSMTPLAGEGVVFDWNDILNVGGPPADPEILELYGTRKVGLPDFVPGPLDTPGGVLRIRSETAREDLGAGAAPGGDFDGDGYPDLALGAPGIEYVPKGSEAVVPSSGSCYVIRGRQDMDEALILTAEMGEAGIAIVADEVPGFGRSIVGGFDWNADGVDDLFIGGRGGEAYVVLGGRREEADFVRGDATANGALDLTDAIFILGFLFLGGSDPACLDACDVDDGGSLDLTDPIYLLTFLFLGGREIPAPYPGPGKDPTADGLRCLR